MSPCKDYLHNTCELGDDCPFAHNDEGYYLPDELYNEEPEPSEVGQPDSEWDGEDDALSCYSEELDDENDPDNFPIPDDPSSYEGKTNWWNSSEEWWNTPTTESWDEWQEDWEDDEGFWYYDNEWYPWEDENGYYTYNEYAEDYEFIKWEDEMTDDQLEAYYNELQGAYGYAYVGLNESTSENFALVADSVNPTNTSLPH